MNPVEGEVPGWTEVASVHVQLFDLQHKHLFKLIHRLETEMTGARGRDRIHEFLRDVADYAAEHLATEEAVLRAYGYPAIEAHIKHHRKFAEMVANFQRREVAGDPALNVSVLRELKAWAMSHVQGTDKLYTEYLNACGMR
jgi:hemerythrin-like metal-binding protein